jgi:predicted double-glycine peptidase
MHILELVIMLVVCGGSGAGGYFALRRWPKVRYPVLAAGFILLALNLLSRLMTDHFYILFPESFSTELLYACSFILVGVLSARYLDTSFRRIIFLVFAIVLSYFTLADHVYFTVAAGKVKSLNGKVEQGVTQQSTSFSCVPCSLATVLRRWGLEYTEGDVAYAVRSSFRGTSLPRMPGAVSRLGALKKLQAKVIRTTWEKLRRFDVPCLLSTRYFNIQHCSSLIGLDDEWVVAGEPLAGVIRRKRDKYTRDWKWDGYAVVVAPDFLHSFGLSDNAERCEQLFASLESLGYVDRTTETVKKFQAEHSLEQTGVLDWRTILVIDALTGPPDRPRLSACAKSFKEKPAK